MDIDYAIQYLKTKDSIMNEIINIVGKYDIKLRYDPFLAIIESIIYQQITVNTAQSIYQKFVNHYRNSKPTFKEVLLTSDEIMRSFGLSRRKIEYIKLFSKNIIDGNINLKFTNKKDEEIINQLIQIKGIGIWTANMFLIFSLGRLDVFPIQDLGIKKAIKKWYLSNTTEVLTFHKMTEISAHWIPYRSIASWYLWKSLAI